MKIANKISLSFLAAAMILTSAASAAFYVIAKDVLKSEIAAHLMTTAESRKETVEIYLKMLRISVGQLSKSVVLEQFLRLAPGDPGRAEAFRLAIVRLERTKDANPSIAMFLVMDASGTVVASSDPSSIGLDRSGDAFFVGGQRGAFIKDAYVSDATHEPMIAASAPITDSATGALLGVLAARVRLTDLYKIVTSRTGLWKTGEIYIVNKYGYMITPSLFLKDTFLKQEVDTENYRRCVSDRGKDVDSSHVGACKELFMCRDYRGRMVLGTHAHIPEMQWSILTEVNLDEAYAPLRRIEAVLLVIWLLVPVAAWILGALISVALTRPIHKLHRGTERITAGNLDFKVGTRANDEIGQLSRSFDEMTEHLRMSTTSVTKLNSEVFERRRAEELLRQSERKTRAIFNATFQFIGLMTPDGILTDANKSAVDFTGVKQEDILNRPFWETPWWRGNEERVQKLKESIRLAASGKFIRYEVELQGAGDTTAIFDFSIKPIQDAAGRVVYLIPEGRDITDQKMAAEAMRRLAAQNELILHSAGEGIIGLDCNGNHVFINPAAAKMLGYEVSELIGRVSHPLWHHSKADGTPYEREKCPIYATFATGAASSVTDEVFWKKDGTSFPVEYTATPIKEGAVVTGTVIVFHDITERKRAEAMVREATEVKAQFVSMVSHELRTPLTAIEEGIGIVLDGSAGSVNNEQKEFLDLAKRNVDRLARLINDVLDYQKLEAGRMVFRMQPADMGAVIDDAVHAMEPLAKNKGLYLKAAVAKNLPMAICDKDKIMQVLINVINNAIKFTEQGGITVTAAAEGGAFIKVSVRDTGPGIREEDTAKLFQDFSQLEAGNTRKTGSTGLGLAISKKIVLGHKGRIWIESKPGHGSDFIFTIPVKT